MTHTFYIYNEVKPLVKREMLERFPYLKGTVMWAFICDTLNDDYRIIYYPEKDRFEFKK
jgi:hypothetical protein